VEVVFEYEGLRETMENVTKSRLVSIPVKCVQFRVLYFCDVIVCVVGLLNSMGKVSPFSTRVLTGSKTHSSTSHYLYCSLCIRQI
jgi:hypothetical protein